MAKKVCIPCPSSISKERGVLNCFDRALEQSLKLEGVDLEWGFALANPANYEVPDAIVMRMGQMPERNQRLFERWKEQWVTWQPDHPVKMVIYFPENFKDRKIWYESWGIKDFFTYPVGSRLLPEDEYIQRLRSELRTYLNLEEPIVL